ncbi:hypothetical protein GYMLUDRAFT_76580 [Collybiopsis luxurians FD-317 M1]|uniref:BTB domain-containing protein n=1 Tax=Collybiopsis luxurians FD-317 M1 TaxID=944289 RepID=A0A0D0CBE1_9AGAR|nr:hypothetical protein GYMLUDRAFT_76580 [Collybiopsis luxurians FD-317 M1]
MSLITPDVEAVPKSSNLFNSADADIVVQSSDNVQFHLHKNNLQCTTGGLPPVDISNDKETVYFPESSATLELLFQFVYPRQFPSLTSLDFDSLLLLAEAAEKYKVFAACTACFYRLREFEKTHPKQILEFAGKHDYRELAEDVQPILVDTPLSELVDILPSPMIFRNWSLFRERHLMKAVEDEKQAFSRHKRTHKCNAALSGIKGKTRR